MPTKAAPRRTDYVPLPEIVAAIRNPKAHAPDRVIASIRRWGFIDPVLEDERTGRLVAGHGRLEALTSMAAVEDAEPPDGILLDKAGTWLVPVTRGWASRSDEDAHAAGVALNRLTELGGWDNRELAELLQEFGDADPDLLELTGHTQEDLDALIKSFGDLPDLDDLAGEVGEPTDEDGHVRVTFKVPPEIAKRWADACAATGIGDETGAAATAVTAAWTALCGDRASD